MKILLKIQSKILQEFHFRQKRNKAPLRYALLEHTEFIFKQQIPKGFLIWYLRNTVRNEFTFSRAEAETFHIFRFLYRRVFNYI